MSKSTRNSGKQWKTSEIQKIKELVKHNTPTGLIAWELKRTMPAIYTKASEEGISLKPTNQSP